MTNFSFKNYNKPKFSVEWIDGETVNIFIPSKALFDKITRLTASMNVKDTENVLETLNSLVAEILSNNDAKRTFTVEELNGVDLDFLFAFVTEYVNFINNSLKGKN
ncbi:MAG: hypothetical protein ACI4RU_04030 [Acutalibacteraceae bacterium]